MNNSIIVLLHNIRSAHNVGSILRSADGFGAQKVLLTGYTPYPQHKNDPRLPHLASRMNSQISKTALGAEKSVDWEYQTELAPLLEQYRSLGFTLAALEQTSGSRPLIDYAAPAKLLLLFGNEIEGLETEVLEKLDEILEIPMLGEKESFNVASAAAIAMYHCRYIRQ